MDDAVPTFLLPWRVTSYLKGVAIAAVIVNHYAILYFNSPQTYANSLMSIFFLLSGAGIYISLERGRGKAGQIGRITAGYAYRRASRVYPLYWLAYLLFIVELYAVYGFTDSFQALNLAAAFAGFPVDPRGIYWFVTAIIQCYLAAPLLYQVVRRQGEVSALGTALFSLAAALLVTVFLLDRVGNETLRDMLEYKEIFLGNVLLFFLGMLIPRLAASGRERLGGTVVWVSSLLALALLVYLTDTPDLLFAVSEVYLAPLLFLAAFTLCLSLAAADPALPLGRLLRLAGDNSYPLYLLHLPFFILLAWWGIIRNDSYGSIAWTVLVFPLFFAACAGLQALFSRGRDVLGGRLRI